MNPYLAALRVVCTHAGDYPDAKVWQFGESIPGATGRYGWPVNRTRSGEMRIVPGQEVRRIRQTGGPGRFRCGVCKRNPRPSLRDWHRICEAWRRDGRDTLDISDLDRAT